MMDFEIIFPEDYRNHIKPRLKFDVFGCKICIRSFNNLPLLFSGYKSFGLPKNITFPCFNFNKNYFIILFGNNINFSFAVMPVLAKNNKSFFGQKFSGHLFPLFSGFIVFSHGWGNG